MEENKYNYLIIEAQRNNIHRYVVGAIVERENSVLLLKRPKEDFMGGIYELPSGKVESGESLDKALSREVEEETGLTIGSIVRYFGYFDYESKSGGKTRQFNFLVSVNYGMGVVLQEHETYTWAQKEEVNDFPVTESVKKILSYYWENRGDLYYAK